MTTGDGAPADQVLDGLVADDDLVEVLEHRVFKGVDGLPVDRHADRMRGVYPVVEDLILVNGFSHTAKKSPSVKSRSTGDST